MKQLKLPLIDPKEKIKTKTDMFSEVWEHLVFRKEFFEWVSKREQLANDKGYAEGMRDGIAKATPQERYQGEFGIRSNY
jgi:hypothetical protein